MTLMAFIAGVVAGGAIVFIYYAAIKKKVEETIPGDPPAAG